MMSPLRRTPFGGNKLWMAALAGAVLALPAGGVSAQPPAKKNLRAEEKTLVTKMGISLKITYFPSNAGEEAPVAVLLHGKAGNRLVWKDFAVLLQQNDFAVVTVDLSGHGESGTRFPKPAASGGKKAETGTLRPAEYQAMVADDLEAVKKFLFDEHQKKLLNMTKLAIAAADFSSAVAIVFADRDWQKLPYDDAATLEAKTPRGQDVRALILLSPEEQVPGLNAAPSLSRLRAVGMQAMVGVAKGDRLDKGSAKKIHDLLAPKKVDGDKQYVYFVEYEGKLRGTDLFNRELNPDAPKVEANMYNFLDKHVKQLPFPWRDRRSRIEREE
jgi:pimeloyl-ACP methyl ester carboxylesterase